MQENLKCDSRNLKDKLTLDAQIVFDKKLEEETHKEIKIRLRAKDIRDIEPRLQKALNDIKKEFIKKGYP